MDMKKWAAEQIAAERKKPLPVLSFPAVQMMGCTVAELIASPELQAEAMRLVAGRVDAAASVSFMDLSVEAEAFGSTVVVSDDEVPTVVGSVVDEDTDPAGLAVPEVGANAAVGVIGETTTTFSLVAGDQEVALAPLQEAWEARMEPVFPYRTPAAERAELPTVPQVSYTEGVGAAYHGPALLGEAGKPRVIIPVFPGNNCEFDSARAFERAGARASTLVVNNLTPAAVTESTEALVRAIGESQIIMIPGGFSGGDEPDGSAKFICSLFRSPRLTDAVHSLLKHRDGLMLGICNGFQALVKLGLVPFGEIRPMDGNCPTLTYNLIGRHQSRYVTTRVASVNSPWMLKCQVGDLHTIPISHGEGRFVAPAEVISSLIASGQVGTQYVDASGQPTMDILSNPNGSMEAIEGIFSPDGRVFGKMAHLERRGPFVGINIPGEKHQPLFESGAAYFA